LKGKQWTPEEEINLKQLAQAGKDLATIAVHLGRRKEAVAMKCRRLGIEVVVTSKEKVPTTTYLTLPLSKEIPSQEEALKMLAGAFKVATKPGLTKTEVHRLKVISTIARSYDLLLANYVRYRQIEIKLMELEQKYAQLAERTQNNETGHDTGQASKPQA
jgi:hypothetical protein